MMTLQTFKYLMEASIDFDPKTTEVADRFKARWS